MDFSNLKNKLLICLCCVVIILPFFLITFTYASEEENVDYNILQVNDICISSAGSLIEASNFISYFLELEKGYRYIITFDNPENHNVRTGFCDDTTVNSSVYNYSFVNNNFTITVNSDDYNYFYFCFGDSNTGPVTYTITKELNDGLSNTVAGLVDNVGISQIWDIFDISINYIVIVVLVAFGIYIIFRIIRKISKGKEGL